MAVTLSRYNHTTDLFLGQEIDLTGLKVMLLNDAPTFDATHTTMAEVEGSPSAEVSGNGWDAGGEALAGAAVTVVSTSGAMLDATDLEVTATGGDIGPADRACIYDANHSPPVPLWNIDFGADETAGVGTPFRIVWNANGIARVTSA